MVNHSLNFVGSPLKHGRLMESSFLLSEDVMEATRAAWISALVAKVVATEAALGRDNGEGISHRGQATGLNRERGDDGEGLGEFIGGIKGEALDGRRA
jgi:hypothetical protein